MRGEGRSIDAGLRQGEKVSQPKLYRLRSTRLQDDPLKGELGSCEHADARGSLGGIRCRAAPGWNLEFHPLGLKVDRLEGGYRARARGLDPDTKTAISLRFELDERRGSCAERREGQAAVPARSLDGHGISLYGQETERGSGGPGCERAHSQGRRENEKEGAEDSNRDRSQRMSPSLRSWCAVFVHLS